MSALIGVSCPPDLAIGDTYTANSGTVIVWQDADTVVVNGITYTLDRVYQDDVATLFYVEPVPTNQG